MNDKEIKYRSILMWRNYIQTGDIHWSSQDAVNIGKPEKAKMLSSDQQEFVIRLEELAKEQL